ncbi:MAG: short-chain fatty acyl-CoA regulator family protein [Rhodospirillales bacterium]|nr:short-chain fatty acyl-CoA regulator family protein [Rhodospirillales bacterium]
MFVCRALIAINHIDPASHHLSSIGCEITFADQMICSDGLNLEFPKLTVPVGISCQVCDRAHCPNA